MADDRFYVKTLRMQNFRCFEDEKLGPFDPHFNLLVGENGAGKTTVLSAIARLFRAVGNFQQDKNKAGRRKRGDFRYVYRTNPMNVTSLSIAPSFTLQTTADFETREIEALETLHIEKHDDDFPATIIERKTNVVASPGRKLDGQLAEKICPIVLFYRADRSFPGPGPGLVDLQIVRWRLRESAYRSWQSAKLTGEDLRDWFRTETLASLQSLEREKQTGRPEVRMLPIVNRAVVGALDKAEQIEFDADLEDIVIRFTDGTRQTFASMSDGQRAMIGLFADLARRACILNTFYLGEKTLEETPGLVLVDEIDLHLHPKWQRQIVPALKRIFPKIQFFATTHSPQVIGEAKPEEIVLLTADGKQKRPSGSYGMDSNWILECVMNAEGRDPDIAKRIKSVFDFIEHDQLADAKAEIERLRQELPGLAPEIVSAESYIWNLEHGSDEAAE